MKLKKCLVCICAAVLILSIMAPGFADEKILRRWSKTNHYKDDMGSEVWITATYYAAEYIEALVQSEANKNLWTSDEAEQYKYELLKTLTLEEYIPIFIEFDNRGPSMHMAPFGDQLTLWVGKNKLKPVDYDKRFNFKLQGKRDGFIYFPRFDEKGKPILEGVKSIRLVVNGGISSVTMSKTIEYIWDVVDDNPERLYAGKAAARLELDRLIKRLDVLNGQKKDLEGQLAEVEEELRQVQKRVEELQHQ
ncbi:MAG: hypothetical protein PHE14_04430 [Aminobacterium colombiense]|uniref:Uncharacterized protein n=1 Tax=Aminobacterium colombiense (strain DSM 12261 / ALA-1) TaxID=572547 RepID=D5EGB7_AMICL|nr:MULTISPECIES: hypothetical protein [Aminobacterium]ADE57599.1 hypothetical protein Amico_1482 [Aminobacterium colombiense DSM 12261]MDD3768137.1 hypothetical protein [Aminobacterium colombiense]MDD4265677.1 hypothetical protein [Aminobacterium colombiense]MDD4585855.1 hypothetical protein [Aminobacterium colombiense]